MKRDIRDRWTAALRSETFKQGKYGFRDLDDRYDAVGVLLSLAVDDGIITAEKYEGDEHIFTGWLYDHDPCRTTQTVEDWSGLSHWQANRVCTLNDKGMKFVELADLIEEKY